MTEFSFTLSDEYTDRLFAVKQLQGQGELTGNQYARRLLEQALYSLFPATPEYDENGELINPEAYKGHK